MFTALISVTDKTGLEQLTVLADLGWEIIATGETATRFDSLSVACTLVETFTGVPEMCDGLVKTTHPFIYAGIRVDRRNEDHMEELRGRGIRPIDLVVVNLYKMGETPSISNIDIEGIGLIRAAAKNWQSVGVVVDTDDYHRIIHQLTEFGTLSNALRQELARKAFELTANYDATIAQWMRDEVSVNGVCAC